MNIFIFEHLTNQLILSQRRVRGGIAVQIYLCVEGSGEERAEMMRNFYNHALQGEETKFKYPDIDPSCMASLETLLGHDLNTVLLIHIKHAK